MLVCLHNWQEHLSATSSLHLKCKGNKIGILSKADILFIRWDEPDYLVNVIFTGWEIFHWTCDFQFCFFLGLRISYRRIWNDHCVEILRSNQASLRARKYFVGPTLSPPLVYLEDLHYLPDAASQPVQLCIPPENPSAQISLHLPRVRGHLQVGALPDPRHQELSALHAESWFSVSISST